MIHHFPHEAARHPVRMVRFLTVAWVVILAKCLFVAWALPYWEVPIEPVWVIAPTLLLAYLATWLWLALHDD